LVSRSSSLERAPAPAATIAITAPMPMMIPKLVSADRPLFNNKASSATRRAERRLMAALYVLLDLSDLLSLPSRRLPAHDPVGQRHEKVVGRLFDRVGVDLVAGETPVARGQRPLSVFRHDRIVRHQQDCLVMLVMQPLELCEDFAAG